MSQQNKKLRVLIVSPYFFPENFRINDVAQDLTKKGHQVTVLTGQPNYPNPNLFIEFRKQNLREQTWENIKIYRVPIVTRGNGGGIRRVLNYLSFIWSAMFWIIQNSKKHEFDIVVTWASSPITSALPALFLCRQKNIPHAIWIQDMWPETLVALNIVQSPFLLGILDRVVKFIYQRSDLIWGQSKGFKKAISQRVPQHPRIQVLYNWGDETLPSIEKPILKSDLRLKILYAGNLGHAQLLDTVLNTVEEMKEEKILWTFIGGGVLETWLRQEIIQRGLTSSAQVLDRVNPDVIPHYGKWADVLLLSLKSDGCLSLTIPSKLQTYMLWGKPILGLIEGDAAVEIKNADCGLTASPEQPDLFARAIHQFLNMSDEQKQTYGENARLYANRHFSRREILDTLERDLLSFCS